MAECTECGNSFIPSYWNQKICLSEDCKRTRNLRLVREHRARKSGEPVKQTVIKTCPECNNQHVRGHLTCSTTCSEKYLRKRANAKRNPTKEELRASTMDSPRLSLVRQAFISPNQKDP